MKCGAARPESDLQAPAHNGPRTPRCARLCTRGLLKGTSDDYERSFGNWYVQYLRQRFSDVQLDPVVSDNEMTDIGAMPVAVRPHKDETQAAADTWHAWLLSDLPSG